MISGMCGLMGDVSVYIVMGVIKTAMECRLEN